MNILFVYSVQKSITIHRPLKGQEDIQMGIALISSVLKNGGHQTSLAVLDRRNKNKNFKLIDSVIARDKPNIVCFTAVNSEIDFILETGQYIKNRFGLFSVIGGVHVTINPDEKYLDTFDCLCIGEGEYSMLELADKLENKEDITRIENLWLKQNGEIFKNKTRPFIENLDALPFADREIWQPRILEKNSRLTVLLGRGCPYNCTYCCNHKLKQVTTGKYVRMRSPKNIAREIQSIAEKFPGVSEYFLEIETLGADIDWLLELCEELFLLNKNRKTRLTFGANLRVYDKMDFELVFNNLGKAGFTSVIIGLESGNERIRKEVLNRHYSNETIISAVKTARAKGLKVGIFNLIGLLGETIKDFRETLALNQLLQPDWHATSIFYPYEGTKLFEVTKNSNLLPQKINTKNERQIAVLDLPGFSKREIQKQFDRFHFEVYRKSKEKSPVKWILFYIQTIAGHNFMANIKIRLIRLIYTFGIKTSLVKIVQKT